MAQFACVVPVHIAEALQGNDIEEDLFGNYHLFLAHDVLEHPAEYRRICQRIRERFFDAFIIMDNSIVELGTAMQIHDLMEACKITRANCVVAPDVMGNGQETRSLTMKFIHDYITWMQNNVNEYQPSIMAVIQGESFSDAWYTFEMYKVFRKHIKHIAVPRILVKQHGSRTPIVHALASKWIRPVHLLGFSDDLIDDITCARMMNVRGIDSAVPIRAGMRGIALSLDSYIDPGPRETYWTDAIDTNAKDALVRQNIKNVRYWIGNKTKYTDL